MLWAPLLLLLSLVSALVSFTGILGEDVSGAARVLFLLFLGLFFGSAVLEGRKRGTTEP